MHAWSSLFIRGAVHRGIWCGGDQTRKSLIIIYPHQEYSTGQRGMLMCCMLPCCISWHVSSGTVSWLSIDSCYICSWYVIIAPATTAFQHVHPLIQPFIFMFQQSLLYHLFFISTSSLHHLYRQCPSWDRRIASTCSSLTRRREICLRNGWLTSSSSVWRRSVLMLLK